MPQVMAGRTPIIAEIESALRDSSNDKRIKVLTSVTDLFAGGAKTFSDAETRVFDDVIGHLIKHVESRALVELSRRLAPIPNAPAGTVQQLARNDAIEISGPILSGSERLSDSDLIDIAQTKSQAHLASIARRTELNETITDILVDKGNASVANEIALNPGARISNITMEKLAMRAEGDDRLTLSMCRRKDVSPAMFRDLTLRATEAVRVKLLATANPEQKDLVGQVLDELAAQVGKKAPPPRNYADAQRTVAAFSQDTKLTRLKLLEFANGTRVAELIVALSVLSGTTVDQVDALFMATNAFGLMVLCKSIGLDWNTAYAVLKARPAASAPSVYDELRVQYEELSLMSAQRLIHFWLGRQRAARNFATAVR